MLKIVCNKCNQEFTPTQNMLIETRLAPDLTEVYFLCPECNAKHHVCCHNAETKNLQKLIKKAESTKDDSKVEEYKARLKKCMDELNNRL